MATPQPGQITGPAASTVTSDKPVVVGIYGLPGSGKSFRLNQLKQLFGSENFAFYEGSEMIAAVVPSGLEGFKKMENQEQTDWRQRAIDEISRQCRVSKKVAIVAGHYMFWEEGQESGQPVCTQNDLDTFTHIIYLDVPAEIIEGRIFSDNTSATKIRQLNPSVTHLHEWQQAEETQLRDLCRTHGILFTVLYAEETLLGKFSILLRDFQLHTEANNLACAEKKLDQVITAHGSHRLEKMLVIDGDKTLAAADTGKEYWRMIAVKQQSPDKERTLDDLFGSKLGYSYISFRQATLLYEETADEQEFEILCHDLASTVTVHPEFISLLQLMAKQQDVGAVIVTSGLRLVWKKVLEMAGLSKNVEVVGGGRIADGFVVTAQVKAALVARLQRTHDMYVWAFGDSPLDLEMLKKADQAIVVVGEEHARSKSMELALAKAIDKDGLRVRQLLLPSTAKPRLDATKLPVIQITEDDVVGSILRNRKLRIRLAANSKAAKLLMTPTRDATVAGPALREAHRRIGWYLATGLIADIVGVEEYPIQHVQGHQINGRRLLYESETLIVALMRGGEPMAFGVNEAFPLAGFLHASHPEQVLPVHLKDQRSVILVDSVVNSGKTAEQFIHRIRDLNATIRIVMVAGVVQDQSISGGSFAQALGGDDVSLVALRLSENKYTGKGPTDTGHRLFNTTRLD
ncbi:MAG: hypothetical protein LQ343_007740 [Gyalolechia ehrenbergii]|nr:MAG: hypothetical protein LQ343_007740 [Gyalolechia ehrenbergii]